MGNHFQEESDLKEEELPPFWLRLLQRGGTLQTADVSRQGLY